MVTSKTKMHISKESYSYHKLFMVFLRLIGLFPLTVEKTNSGLFLNLSPFWLFYGFLFGGISICFTYLVVAFDINLGKEGVTKLLSTTNQIVMFLSVSSYCVVTFWGVFITPIKYLQFFRYINCINEVDSIIKPAYKNADRYKLLLAMCVSITVMTSVGYFYIHVGYKNTGDKVGFMAVFWIYFGLIAVAVKNVIVENTRQIILKGLERRIGQLNNLLDLELSKITNTSFFSNINSDMNLDKTIASIKVRTQIRDATNKRNLAPSICTTDIIRLNKAYLKIMDAVDNFNQLFGFCSVLMILSTLWTLLQSSYFSILVLIRTKAFTIALAPRLALLVSSIIRVLVIIEPSYANLSEVETTKRLVCHFLSSNIKGINKKQIKRFLLTLGLRKLEISAWNILIVDRFLFTSLIGTLTTLLVILLQFQGDQKY